MPPSHEQDRAEFQRELDGVADNSLLPLMPREYAGPIVLNRALVLDGQGSTIWSLAGPVVSCQAKGITLRNLRIEVTGATDTGGVEDQCALKVAHGYTPTFENVEVRGTVIGIPQEEGEWRYPHTLQIGSVPFGSESDLIMRVWVPVPCEVSSKISGLEVQPRRLEPGTNEITLHIERIAKDTLLSGMLFITTPHLRRSIVLNGYISNVKAKKSRSKKPVGPSIVYQPADWDILLTRPKPVVQVPLPPPPELVGDIHSFPRPQDSASNPVARETVASEPTVAPISNEPVTSPTSNIQWPPKPSPPVKLPPPEPIVVPPSGPSTGTSPPLSPPQPSPPNRRRMIVIAGVGGLALVLIALAAWWLFISGDRRINYAGVQFARSLQASDEVRAVAFSPDGTLVAGGSKDGIIKVWDTASGDLKIEMPKGADASSLSEITSLAFSPDGKLLASGRADANVVIWDPQTGSRGNTLRGHSQRVNSVAFSPDGQTVVSGADDTTVKLWDPTSMGGQPKKSLNLDSPVKAVAFSVDGAIVAGAGGAQDGHLRMWDVATWSQKPEITKSAVMTSLSFSKDGKVAAGNASSTVVIWNVQSREQLNTLTGHKSQVNGVAFSPQGESVISGSADTYVLLWDADAVGASKRALTQNSAPVYAVAVSSDGKWIASAGGDKTVKLWANK
jgi:hypothetical protein